MHVYFSPFSIKIARGTQEAPRAVDRGKRGTVKLIIQGSLVETLLEDALDGPVAGVVKAKRSCAGALQARAPVFFGKTDDPLGSPQVVQDPVAEERG